MRRRPKSGEHSAPGAATGVARVGRSSHALLPRLSPGEIAVFDHLDLDRSTARALVDAGVVGVVNAAPSISGRFPNLGPEMLAEAGVVHIDMVGAEALHAIKDGSVVALADGNVSVNGELVAAGRSLEMADVLHLMADARRGMETQLQSFTANTVEFLRREQELLLHGEGAPHLRTNLAGRPVVVVVPGFDFREDLQRVKRYAKEQHPVVIAVDAGADAALKAGLRPTVVLLGESGLGIRGGSGAASDKAIRSAREVVVHGDRSGHVGGTERLAKLGVDFSRVDASATTEDVALLLADLEGASLVVTVGVHATLNEFLDRQRAGLASTFLTQLRVGPKLVSAAALPQVYSGGVRRRHLVAVTLAGVLALAAAFTTTPQGSDVWDSTTTHVGQWVDSLEKAMNL